MSDIIERISGYSDEMMQEWCSCLQRVVTQERIIKEGRGKNKRERKVLKHPTHPDVLERINNSVEFYKTRQDMEFSYRDYQEEIIDQAEEILLEHRFVYLGMQVRTGKTLTSLGLAEKMCVKHKDVDNVLFLTKKKAISSITEDSNLMCPSYTLFIINYESMHKLPDIKWDMIVMDEAHGMGAFPKPSNRAKKVKELIQKCKSYVVLMSGTPTPESYSQMYHQVYGIKTNPFAKYKSFYRFSDDYVRVSQIKINGHFRNNYHDGRERILKEMEPYTINYTQKEAGFKVDTREHIIKVKMSDKTYDLCKRLKKDLVIQGKKEVILADTPVKLMQKLHQMFSGTVKFESGEYMVMDDTKAVFIHDNFGDKKIGIFYKFVAELDALKSVYGDGLTTDLDEFNSTDKSIALQIVSGREGISLRQAEALVYYNIDFSATSYWQSRDRMTTKDRLTSDVYWLFSENGIESKIYKAVKDKKAYTVNHFKQDADTL
jgi:hypothetical protein